MKLLVLCSSLFLSSCLFGQKVSLVNKINAKRYIEKGNQEYYSGRTSSSFMSFKQATVADPTNFMGFQMLATAELDLNYYYGALEHITKAYDLAKKKNDPDLNYIKAQVHHRLNQVDQALVHYKIAFKGFSKGINKDYEMAMKISQCEYALSEENKGIQNLRKPLAQDVTSKHDEYGPILCLQGKHLFFTARKPETMGNNMNPDDQKFFEDIYHAIWNDTTQSYVLETETTEDANSEGFDALSYVSEDGMSMYGTLNTSASRESNTSSSEIVDFSSGDPAIIYSPSILNSKEINTSYFEGSPTITDTTMDEDENTFQTMIFVSDRNGEKKMTDLYQVVYENDRWQEVSALPDYINTTGRETTPFITADGNFLFFSSDALPGFGGYDVYYCKNENGVWSKPQNLGAEFNSVNDDTHFQVYSWKQAVVASIAEVDGAFNYQLFQFDLSKKEYPFLK